LTAVPPWAKRLVVVVDSGLTITATMAHFKVQSSSVATNVDWDTGAAATIDIEPNMPGGVFFHRASQLRMNAE
jgi:broad specificity phosphatase PhoE